MFLHVLNQGDLAAAIQPDAIIVRGVFVSYVLFVLSESTEPGVFVIFCANPIKIRKKLTKTLLFFREFNPVVFE
jgi:hypothetical protein